MGGENKYIPGTVVRIDYLQQASWYLYKKYEKESPLLVCPCHLKRDIPLIVLDHFDNDIVLMQVQGSDILTMTYSQDIRAVYEPNF